MKARDCFHLNDLVRHCLEGAQAYRQAMRTRKHQLTF